MVLSMDEGVFISAQRLPESTVEGREKEVT
jgi:hypothetical protein